MSILLIAIYVQAPVLLLTMFNVALYAYAQPYKIMYINLMEVTMLVDMLLLLMITSTKVILKSTTLAIL